MSGMNRTQVDDLIAAVNAVKEVNKVWDEGRKRRLVNDVAWRHALSEYMENGEIAITPSTKQVKEPESYTAPRDDLPSDRVAQDKPLPGTEEINGMMNEIRRLIDEPERLLESHLGIFTEPAPPGKMLDSQG
jgi:hypothetical protein